ncbi:hypothetical protein CGRA01v4_10428 [Colletotrichum graminicola]|uniref:Uncharacterized protein n=1 Tax=Colletotrichum graminicola (strain M1.001 / M2 / FGSC 10212) TaxID=645133 RepID=E3R025_COLGM|nr:uncharacterized protein GLRG_11590 [Colletotrichum graminicola M1.001]EFQ36445.1 hypothetical protein GLRG_11590 [Colletotrichum graminicola M1.001]WDK19141.1 hypothetical protein CGRA01v4_10428 [Colletotrichum graminicola]
METKEIHSIQFQQALAAQFGSEALLALPNGTIIDLAAGYVPLLGRFTFEDKAAKGLRKRKADEESEPPIYFTALELVRDNQFLLLAGPSGSGKTTFAKHLCFRLASADFHHTRPVVRNDLGHVREEKWDSGPILPYYFTLNDPNHPQTLVDITIPNIIQAASTEKIDLLFAIDAINRAGETAPRLLQQLVSLFCGHKNHRLVLLGVPDICDRWALPPNIARHNLLPMLELHRRQAVARHLGPAPPEAPIATGVAAKNPALFALALQARHCGEQAEDLLDSWLSVTFPRPSPVQELAEAAWNRICHVQAPRETVKLGSIASINNPAIDCTAVQHLLAARHLAGLPLHVAVELFRLQPQAYAPVIKSCLFRLASSGCSDGLVEGLLDGLPTQSQRGALLVADVVGKARGFQDKIINTMLDIITQGTLSATDRDKAGRILSRFGGPRDLTSLAEIPSGSFVMGSQSHPNSQPLGEISLERFRIGVYPVAVRDCSAFVRETGRDWVSRGGADPDRLNTPATDLTWHDARGYCSWLTQHWRKIGKIGSHEKVRLPTEPEWERAARGGQTGTGSEALVYPWGTTWEDDAANSEATDLNATCAVGLFPKGRSLTAALTWLVRSGNGVRPFGARTWPPRPSDTHGKTTTEKHQTHLITSGACCVEDASRVQGSRPTVHIVAVWNHQDFGAETAFGSSLLR